MLTFLSRDRIEGKPCIFPFCLVALSKHAGYKKGATLEYSSLLLKTCTMTGREARLKLKKECNVRKGRIVQELSQRIAASPGVEKELVKVFIDNKLMICLLEKVVGRRRFGGSWWIASRPWRRRGR